MTEQECLAQNCAAEPACRKFMAELVQAMIGEDEEMWRILLERAGSNLSEMPVEKWNDNAEVCIELVVFLLYDGGESPRDILNLVMGVE